MRRWNQAGAERWTYYALGVLGIVALVVVTVRSFRSDPVTTLRVIALFLLVFGAGAIGGLRKGRDVTGRVRIAERKLPLP